MIAEPSTPYEDLLLDMIRAGHDPVDGVHHHLIRNLSLALQTFSTQKQLPKRLQAYVAQNAVSIRHWATLPALLDEAYDRDKKGPSQYRSAVEVLREKARAAGATGAR
jgi:hypothetical protein